MHDFEFFTDEFQADLRKLNILPPDIWCKATDHISEQIDFVKELEAKGFTYRLTDGIYFDSQKLKNYLKRLFALSLIWALSLLNHLRL